MLALSLAVLAAPPALQSFGPEEVLTTGASLRRDVIPCDVDGDGDIDLISVGQAIGQIGWLENRGDGAFGVLRVIDARLPDDRVSASAAVGDLDDDGLQDLVVTTTGLRGLTNSMYRYQAVGGGEYGSRMAITTQGRTSSVRVLDLDGDGDQDVAYVDIDAGLSWMKNLGGGTLVAQAPLTTGFSDSRALRAADLDGDGLDDLLWCDRTARRARWIRNPGGGAFGSARSVGGEILFPTSILSEDVDLDGDRDLLVGGSNAIFWIENVGGGQFLDRTVWATLNGGLVTLAATDLDGDGDRDVVASGRALDSFLRFENLGGGQFGQPVALAGTSADVAAVLAADLDGDGAQDLVHAARDIRWFKNLGASAVGTATSVTRAVPAGLVDADGDDDLDLLGVEDGAVVVAGNLGDGSFGRTLTIATGIAGAEQALALDVGADGDLDIVVAADVPGQGATITFLERTPMGLEAPVEILMPPIGSFISLTVADLDPDGDRDLVLQYFGPGIPATEETLWLRNDAALGLVPLAPQETDGFGAGAFGDVDGDGDADLVTLSRNVNQLLLYLTEPDGSMGAPTVLTTFGPGGGEPVDLGDVDGDGDLDVVFYNGANPSIAWCENLGAGSFAPRVFVRQLPAIALEVITADVDLDGDDDILAWGHQLTWGPCSGRWIESLGGGMFGTVQELPNSAAFQFTTSAVAADLDGDGDLDLFRGQGAARCVQFNERFLGHEYCGPAVPNSTGLSGRITASGSAAIEVNEMVLRASDLPPGSFGYFLAARDAGLVAMPGESQGTLCLGGAVGRLNRGPEEIFQAGGAGDVAVPIDVTDLPSPTGSSAALPGETRYFQAWYRDANPTPTSNFTSGLAVLLRLRK